MAHKKWTTEVEDILRTLYKQGKDDVEIAHIMGFQLSAVENKRRCLHLYRKKRKKSKTHARLRTNSKHPRQQ